jgi:hypothetical protein
MSELRYIVSDATTLCTRCQHPNVNCRHHGGFFHRWFKWFIIISTAVLMMLGAGVVIFIIGGVIYSGTDAGSGIDTNSNIGLIRRRRFRHLVHHQSGGLDHKKHGEN